MTDVFAREHTNSEIANDFRLWGEYFDSGAEMTREEFDAMPMSKRLSMLVYVYGEDGTEGDF